MRQMAEKPPRRRDIQERTAPGAHRRNRAVPRSAEEIKKAKDAVTRRELFKAGAGAVLAAGISLGAFKLYEFLKSAGATDEEAETLAVGLHERDPDGHTSERFLQMSESPLFFNQLKHFIKHYRDHGDLALALSPENGRARTVNDPEQRSRIEYVHEEVTNGVTDEEIPENIRRELSFYATGMFAAESKYQRNLRSGVGAIGLGQAMPDTYESYGKNEDDMRYLSHQVDVTRRAFKEHYATIVQGAREELRVIRTNYFRNNTDFELRFLTLCVVNAYQAGPGNMLNVIKAFSRVPVSENFRSFDVFETMTYLAKDGGFDPDYRNESYNYAKQSSAFAFLLAASDTSAV